MNLYLWVRIYIKGNKTRYVVNEYGDVLNTETGRILAQTTDKYGYKIVSLNYKGKNYKCKVHRLVALAFIPNPENKPTVNHKDTNKSNNYVDNLEWATYDEQMKHAIKMNLIKTLRGEDDGSAKYKERQIIKACELILTNKYSDYAIERRCGLSRGYVYVLRHKLAWTYITDKYF